MSDPERVVDEFSIVPRHLELEPRYNVAPSQGVWVVKRAPRQARELELMRWGMDVGGRAASSGVIMVRAESLATQSMFTAAFRARRCLFIADGFYEWHRVGKRSSPYFFHRNQRAPFAMAGIWQGGEHGPASCAVVTRPAVRPVVDVHPRMPAVLAARHYDAWLDPLFFDAAVLRDMLSEDPGFELVSQAVGTHVNAPANDDPACLLPPSEQGGQKGEQFDLWPGADLLRDDQHR